MIKTLFYLIIAYSLVTGLYSCTKGDTVIRNRPVPQPPSNPPVITDESISADFNYSINAALDNSLADIFNTEYQGTAEYSTLLTASTALLQQANIYYDLRSSLMTTGDVDPHLVLAAKLINDLYVEAPPAIEHINGGYNWTCLLNKLNVPPAAVLDVMKVRSLPEIGSLLRAIGLQWYANQLTTSASIANTNWGSGTLLNYYNWCVCMDETNMPVEPIQFQWPANLVLTFTAEQFNTFNASVIQWHADLNSGWPASWTPASLLTLCTSFEQETLSSISSSTVHYTGYYLCAEPGFMLQLADYVNSPGFIMPEHP